MGLAQGRDHESDLALGVFAKLGGGLGRSADKDLLEFFGQLAANGQTGFRRKNLGRLGQGAGNPVGRLKVHGGVAAGGGGG